MVILTPVFLVYCCASWVSAASCPRDWFMKVSPTSPVADSPDDEQPARASVPTIANDPAAMMVRRRAPRAEGFLPMVLTSGSLGWEAATLLCRRHFQVDA